MRPAKQHRLTRRAEFLAAAKGRRIKRPGFVLQAVTVEPQVPQMPQFGFTVTKKTGNAVVRNRIRRRLKAAVQCAADRAEMSTNYVLIGRRAALTLSFQRLVADLRSGLEEIAAGGRAENRAH